MKYPDQGNGAEGTVPINDDDNDEDGTTYILYFSGKNPQTIYCCFYCTQTFFHAFIVKSFKFVDISFPSYK